MFMEVFAPFDVHVLIKTVLLGIYALRFDRDIYY